LYNIATAIKLCCIAVLLQLYCSCVDQFIL